MKFRSCLTQKASVPPPGLLLQVVPLDDVVGSDEKISLGRGPTRVSPWIGLNHPWDWKRYLHGLVCNSWGQCL